MAVIVRLHGIFAELFGSKELEVECASKSTISELIKSLKNFSIEGASEILRRIEAEDGARIIILVNGRNIIYTGWLDTEIKEGDRVDIIPPLAGG